ncbi:MAG: hypothetical protein LBC03_03295 [Nitrososphaerota archaeon]|jgi:hypothetical protein|nr:hypothetical protein [Nitrososphaerota archaeon]
MTTMPLSLRYKFSQSFTVPPKQAYLWCTDFSSQDHQLMGHNNAKRQVIPISEGVVILKDVFYTSDGDVEKQKLVHLYPDLLSWTSTHLTGPNKHSQFRYEILTEACGCRLDYEALHVEYGKDILSSNEVLRFTELLCRADLEVWRFLALALEQGLK